MNDDNLRRLLRNSLQGRRAPAGLAERVIARLGAAPRRPLALTLAAAAALLTAAALKMAFPRVEAPAVAPAAAPLPSVIVAAMEQHAGTSDLLTRGPALAPRELLEKVREESGFFVDLPGLREAGFEPREVHRCLEKGFAHVLYANSWSKLSCFLFEDSQVAIEGGKPVAKGAGQIFTRGDVTAVAVKDGSLVKVWVSELKDAQLAAIAMDVELKRDSLMTTVLAGVKGKDVRTVEAVLRGIPGVEYVTVEPGRSQATVQFDERLVSRDMIGAQANMNGVAEGLADAGAEGR